MEWGKYFATLLFIVIIGIALLSLTFYIIGTIKNPPMYRNETYTLMDSLITAKVDSTIDAKFGMIVHRQKDWSILLSEMAYHRMLLLNNNPSWRVQMRLGTYQYYWGFKRWGK